MLRTRVKFIIFSVFLVTPAFGEILVDDSNPTFASYVETELTEMRDGKRGLVCQRLVERLDEAKANTTIYPLSRDEDTWHPNDRKGKRSWVLPMDTKIRDGAREEPTHANYYVHPSRINPALSTFQLGTFVHELSKAADLNEGVFSGDFVTREKRAAFHRNAWRDSFGYSLVEISGRVVSVEYQFAKMLGLIEEKYKEKFPILNHHIGRYKGDPVSIDVSSLRSFELIPANLEEGDAYAGFVEEMSGFLKVLMEVDGFFTIQYGMQKDGEFEIHQAVLDSRIRGFVIKLSEKGFDFESLLPYSEVMEKGTIEGNNAWAKAFDFERSDP